MPPPSQSHPAPSEVPLTNDSVAGSTLPESREVTAFRSWLSNNGSYIHPDLQFVKDSSGMSIYAVRDIPPDTQVVSCPFSLAITPELAKHALSTISPNTDSTLNTLSERELICTYLIIHLIADETRDEAILASTTDFKYLPYLRTLPPADALRTSLHFTETELSLLRGTNIFGATIDRLADWDAEWKQCKSFVRSIKPSWEPSFTWARYLATSTYTSSRAFPSTLLSRTPSLVATPASHPVLLPGLDALNHSRAHRVSWLVDAAPAPAPAPARLQVSLVLHTRTPAHTEVCNNYGPKPNAELILGYGFALPANPDDTIVLRVGGQAARWEVGRDARGGAALLAELRRLLGDGAGGEAAEWEVDLDVAETLKEMVESKLAGMPELPAGIPEGVRADVWGMIQHYVTGQREILQSLLAFAGASCESAFAKAKESGVELVFEDGDDDAAR